MTDGNTSWRSNDIIYVSIIGPIMLAAAFEWLLWLLAWLYCFTKVYQKAENRSTRNLSITMMILFSLTRITFLPVLIVSLPLPPAVFDRIPLIAVEALQWFAFGTFTALIVIPWLLCLSQLITNSVGRTPLVKHIIEESEAPKIIIIVPCYREVPEILLRTVDSLVDCDYPSACIHVFLSFDGDQEDELYLGTLEKLGVDMVRQSGYPTAIDIIYSKTRITVSRFAHGGKRHCQMKAFALVNRVYKEFLQANDDVFVLFIDSDCILDKSCLQNFMYEMEIKPGGKSNMIAMTGVITATTGKTSFITLLQDIEYVHGQLFERSVESACGAVTCLPGALTILRMSAFRKLAKFYFADKAEQCDDLFDYGKCHLGEDRWLTHLFMIAAQRGQIGMSTGAFCKTEAVGDWKSLLKQRRRWFLGFITNEACVLTDKRVWMKYPILCIVRVAQNTIRTSTLLFLILVVALCTTSRRVEDLPIGFIVVSLGLNWVLMIYFATLLGRYKIMLYPVLFFVGPFLNWICLVYGVFTAGQRTWGGPRADAGQADLLTSAQEVIEYADSIGDDLNIVPESFRPAAMARHTKLAEDNSHLVQGLEDLPSHAIDHGTIQSSNLPHIPLHPRPSQSFESLSSVASFAPHYRRYRRDSMDDLEAGSRKRVSRAHPPMAASAFFAARHYRRSPYGWDNSEASLERTVHGSTAGGDLGVSMSLMDMDPMCAQIYSSPGPDRGSFDRLSTWPSVALNPFDSQEYLTRNKDGVVVYELSGSPVESSSTSPVSQNGSW